jgi:hypothetical protein
MHKKGFNIKGGLFTEFANRNKVVIDLNRKERMEKQQMSPITHSSRFTRSPTRLTNEPKETLVDRANEVIEKNHLYKIKNALTRSITLNNNK